MAATTTTMPILLNAPANYKSKIWVHFGFRFTTNTQTGKKEPIKELTTCKYCFQDVSYKAGNTSNMAHHMRRHHPQIDITACSRVNKSEDQHQIRSTVSGQLRLQDAFVQKMPMHAPKSLAITKSIGTFIAGDMRSFSLVKSPHFKALVATLDPKYQLPSRIHFSHKVIPDLYNETLAQVRENLKTARTISLTTDGWTSRSTQSYVTITAHYIDPHWKLKGAVLQTRELSESHTSENLAGVLTHAVTEWNIQRHFSFYDPITCSTSVNPRPVAITSDNAQNIVKGIELAGLQPHIRCFAHSLNLSAQKAIEVNSVSRVLGRIRRIVTFFHHSSTATKMLHDKQKALELPNHKLIQDIKTRWNSSYDMVERYLEQQPAVFAALRDPVIKKNIKDIVTLSDDDIQQCEALVVVLKPFKTITTLMFNEQSPTISLIHPLRERLLKGLTVNIDDDHSSMIDQVKCALRNDLKTRYTQPAIVEVLEISCALDPRFHTLPYHTEADRTRVFDVILNKILAAKQMVLIFDNSKTTLIKDEPKEQLVASQMKPDLPSLDAPETELPNGVDLHCDTPDHNDMTNSPPTKKSAMEDLFGDVFIVKDTPPVPMTTRAENEIKQYRTESTLPLDNNPLSWWKGKEETYPLLSDMAKDYLCIQGTSVPSERVFSTAGDIVTAQRSLLDPNTVDKLIFLKKNL